MQETEIKAPPGCIFPGSHPTARNIQEELAAIAANQSKCSSIYLGATVSLSLGRRKPLPRHGTNAQQPIERRAETARHNDVWKRPASALSAVVKHWLTSRPSQYLPELSILPRPIRSAYMSERIDTRLVVLHAICLEG